MAAGLRPAAARLGHSSPLLLCYNRSLHRISTAVSSTSQQHQHNSDGSTQCIPWLHEIAVSTPGASANGKGQAQTQARLAEDQLPRNLDAVIVLAGGQTSDGGVPPWVERRLDTAYGLLSLQPSTCSLLCLGGGTPHKPPVIAPNGYVIHESTSCADYLMHKHGLPPLRILKEVSSYDTVGNAMFALTIHALPAGWRHVAVVTSDFHMPRTRALFEDMWSRAEADVLQDPGRFTLWFASSSDEGLFERDVLRARAEKEAQSLASWRKTVASLPTLKDIHTWFHASHQCYAVSRQHEFSKRTIKDERLLASY